MARREYADIERELLADLLAWTLARPGSAALAQAQVRDQARSKELLESVSLGT